ncbi:MAG: MarR family transcriptional regulator [Pseudomonadota bacterium]
MAKKKHRSKPGDKRSTKRDLDTRDAGENRTDMGAERRAVATQTSALVDLLERFEPLWRAYQAGSLPKTTSVSRMRVLSLLADQGPMTMTELKLAMGVSAQNITGLVDRLEASNEVERQPDPADRRKIIVKLFKPLKDTVRAYRDDHRRQVGQVFDTLSFKEQKQLSRALSKLVNILEDRANAQ